MTIINTYNIDINIDEPLNKKGDADDSKDFYAIEYDTISLWLWYR